MPNLVLVHTPRYQAREDFEKIAARVRALDPGIATFIATNRQRNKELNRLIESAPTLVFSPLKLDRFTPVRGAVFQGSGRIDKVEEYERYKRAGVPTPRTARLVQGQWFDEALWSDRVVLKPLDPRHQSRGEAIFMVKTSKLNFDVNVAGRIDRYELPGGTAVQQYIDAGPMLEYYRVLALFGAVLYSARIWLPEPVDLDPASYPPNEAVPVAGITHGFDSMLTELVDDEGLHAIARGSYAAIPQCALHAIDVVRSQSTGRLYALEANLGGNTWHFSSAHFRNLIKDPVERKRIRASRINQFGAFDIAARVLVERTRAEAS